MLELTYTVKREIDPEEVEDFLREGAYFPWVQGLDFWDDEKALLTTWDGHQEGGRKETQVTYQQVIDEIAKHADKVDDRDILTDHLGYADALFADYIIQHLAFGDVVYG